MIAGATPDRRTKRARLAAVLVLLVSLGGCRLTEVWSGVRETRDGYTLQLVAKTSLCSCVVFDNPTDQPVLLEAEIGDAETGHVVVPPKASIYQRFDWAGSRPTDYYSVRAWTAQGSQVPFRSHMRYLISPWEDCDQAACKYEPMMMNVGGSGQDPGDR